MSSFVCYGIWNLMKHGIWLVFREWEFVLCFGLFSVLVSDVGRPPCIAKQQLHGLLQLQSGACQWKPIEWRHQNVTWLQHGGREKIRAGEWEEISSTV